jgi:hypothetical protein
MSEAQPSGSKTKMVYRNVAIALVIICIILAASVADLWIVINEKDNTIQTDNDQIRSLNSQVDNLTRIVNGQEWKWLMIQNVSVQPKQHLDVYNFTAANYSGIIEVWMEGLNLDSTWLRVAWGASTIPQFNNMQYNETRNFHGTPFAPHSDYVDDEYFPILKGGYSYITLGNNSNQTITELMRIAYSY